MKINRSVSRIEERDELIQRLNESKRLAENQIRILEENIQYLNERVDELTAVEVNMDGHVEKKGKDQKPSIKQVKS